jgi:hypothetical protein
MLQEIMMPGGLWNATLRKLLVSQTASLADSIADVITDCV